MRKYEEKVKGSRKEKGRRESKGAGKGNNGRWEGGDVGGVRKSQGCREEGEGRDGGEKGKKRIDKNLG
jgi:hypothetical protein